MNPCMMNMCNPYMMGMYNPYMMGAQTLEQYKNMQKVSVGMLQNQANLMGQINPFLSTSKDERLGFQKSMINYQSDLSNIYNPYSKSNVASTKGLMDMSMDYQKMMMSSAMMNPYALGMGYPVMV